MRDDLYEVECRDVWKIYGAHAKDALKAIRSEGLGRQAVQERYGCVLAVAGANLRIRKGEIFCIIGLSGSGKSTLLRHINRLITPTAGEIWVGGQNINTLNMRDLRQLRAQAIGMVFQNMALLPHRTVRDNVVLGLELRGIARDKRNLIADEKLALVELEKWADHMPHELSGGMQQRVGLARALAADPGVLLMDEPFSALDPLIRRQLQDQFINLAAVMKKTTLFITHDIDEAIRIGHHIAIMRDGAIVQSGTAEEIINRPVNDYVESFVQGVSRIHVTQAHSLMQPREAVMPLLAHLDEERCPTARPDAPLSDLIRLSIGRSEPIRVMAENRVVGFISKDALLNSIHGTEKAS